MIVLVVITLILAVILFYCSVCFMIKAYLERGYKEAGSSRTWDSEGIDCFKVLAWPIAFIALAPMALAEKLGRKLWARVHRAELIQKELKNEERNYVPADF